jgi:hypothetical protein
MTCLRRPAANAGRSETTTALAEATGHQLMAGHYLHYEGYLMGVRALAAQTWSRNEPSAGCDCFLVSSGMI